MKNIFTHQKPDFLHVKKLLALTLFFYLQIIFVVPVMAQDPVVTNSATYDVFMNLDPSRGLNPTSFSSDVSSYLNTMGAAADSYRILTSAVTLDPTDVAKWEVYDHYDIAWYANQAAWSASPGGFNNGNIPSNWYYYSVSDPYIGTGNSKITIAQLLAGQGSWGYCGKLQSHIYPFVENGKPAMQFYGYSSIGAADFLYYPADVASTKTVKFNIDAQKIDTHTLISAGFLINGGTSGSGSSKTVSGYLLLISANLTSVNLYRISNVNVDNLHNSGTGAPGSLVATYSSTIYSKSHIELSITSTSVTATIQQVDASGNLVGSKSTMFNSQALTNTGFGGFGPFVLYSSHGCSSASAFRFSNLEMAFGGVMSGSSSLEAYQYAQYLYNSTNRFFVNLTNTAQTNYAATSNDLDNAYLNKIEDDKVVIITDESAGTYLPGTLNQNIKNISSEPSDATLATELGLPDLSSLTAAQQLAAKTAYLILHTTLGSYGTISSSTSTAVASLMLLDGPGTDASWTGAKQINEIKSWLISGSSINIYLKSDMGINTTGLTETYQLKNPSGTITTITTSTDGSGKKYFAFPKASATGEYSVTLSYATGGSITTTVPATEIFNFAPVPALDGNPEISGTMQYGQTLTITPNISVVPGITGTLSYQWKANGANISGATGSTYVLSANEVGKTITCDITSNAQTGTKSATASGTVSKITLSAASVSSVNNKNYDGTTSTTGGTIAFSGTVNSEIPACSATIVWTSSAAGTNTVNVSGITLTGLTDRYTLSLTSISNALPGNNAAISKATPAVSTYPAASAITYGQTLQSSTLSTGSAVVNGVSGAISGSYAWKTPTTTPASAGTFSAATVTFTPSDGSNYNNLDFNISITVSKAPLTVTGASVSSKVYDGNTSATITGASLSGIIGADAVTLGSSTNGTFANASVGTGKSVTVNMTISGASSANYTLTQPTLTGDVIAKAVTVTGASVTPKVYDGNTAATVTGASLNGVLTGDAANVTLNSATSGTFSSADAGTGISVTTVMGISGSASDNYTLTQPSLTGNISAKEVTVTADVKTKIYGEADPELTYSFTPSLVNGDTFTGTLSRADGESAGDYAISIGSLTASSNYSLSFVSKSLTISQKNLIVTADDKSRIYGSSNPGLTFTCTGFVSGEDISVINTLPGVSTSANALSPAGNYSLVPSGASDDNYSFSYVPGTMSVTKAALSAVAEDKSKTYGDSNPSLSISYTGFVNGDDQSVIDTAPVPSTTATVTSDAGTYPISLSPGSDNNYDISNTNGILTVNKATLIVAAENKTRVYGNANPEFTVSYSGFLNNDNPDNLDVKPAASSTETSGSDAGTYEILVSGGTDNNYSFDYTPASLVITKASLQVAADNKTKVYGSDNPELTYTYSGFVNGDNSDDIDQQPEIATTADKSSPVGVYSVSLVSGSDNNYLIDRTDGTLTVTKAPLVATADDKSKTFGQSNPLLTVTYSGFVNGDGSSDLDVLPEPSTAAAAISDAGSYPILLPDASDNNYEISTVDGTLTINKAVLDVTADNKTRKYAQINPELSVSYAGFVNGDDIAVLDLKPTVSTSADQSSNAGSYTISVSGGSDNNYMFNYHDGILEINKADQAITFEEIPVGLRTTQEHELIATSTSGLPVTFNSSNELIASVDGTVLKINKEGTAYITASQAGNNNWNAAANVSKTIETLPTFDNVSSMFSPNNDGMNDYWYLPNIEEYGTVHVKVFNRFGVPVYESPEYKNDWDGTYNGKPLPSASYYYIIKSSEKGIIKGVVNIVR
jgi:gliding motility-associated-like protein